MTTTKCVEGHHNEGSDICTRCGEDLNPPAKPATTGDALFRAFTWISADDLATLAWALQRGADALASDYGVACVAGGPNCSYATQILAAVDRARTIAEMAREAAKA